MERFSTMGDPTRDPPAQHLPTQELVARARADVQRDFRALYERVAPSLYAWARLRLFGRGARGSDSEDFMQEVWLHAWEGFAEYDPARASFRAWIFGIAKNVAYETMRRRPLPQVGPGSRSIALDSWPEVVTSIRSRLARAESIDLLIDSAARLDPLDHKLLLHCGFEDLSCPEAAVRLGIGAEAAKKRWQRLRQRLEEAGLARLLEDV